MTELHNILAKPEQITLLVLCGGAGERMGGIDKPLIDYREKPMIDHVLASVPPSMPKLISANRNLPEYRQRATVVTDNEVEFGLNNSSLGPLTGIYAGLTRCSTSWLLVAPGDTPDLPDNWWRLMREASNRHTDQETHVVAHDGERQQHLHLLLKRDSAVSALTDYLRAGHHKVYKWLENIDPSQAQFNNPDAFRNINSPADLDQANQP